MGCIRQWAMDIRTDYLYRILAGLQTWRDTAAIVGIYFLFLTNHLSSRHVKMHEKPQNIYFSNVVVVRCKEENVLDHSRRVESGPHCQ